MRIAELEEGKVLRRFAEMNNIALVLGNNRLFLNSDYRFMRAQKEKGLLRCVKAAQNGKTKLVYFTEGARPLSAIYGCMNFLAFMSILEKIFNIIDTVESNGFLKPYNLEDSPENIFVEPETLEVKLMYLPVQADNDEPEDNYMRFRQELVRLIHSTPMFTGADVQNICRALENGSLGAAGLSRGINHIRLSYGGTPRVYDEDDPVHGTGQLAANIRLIGKDGPGVPSFHIHKSEFVIGKSRNNADGVIPRSTVSRIHCRVLFISDAYYLEDMDSTNGTRLNSEPLPSGQRRQLMNGDVISIAGTEFIVDF